MTEIKATLLTQVFLLKVIELAKEKIKVPDNERIQKIFTLINDNLTENISIKTLAKAANLSESRFKNWFRETSGFTPLDYVQRKRIEYAVDKIKSDPDSSFYDLANSLNFSSQQYFTAVVKKFTGKTPSEIRTEADRRPINN